MDENKIIFNRNRDWINNKYIPKWVDLETVGLDQFFTKPEIAKIYYDKFIDFLLKEKIDINGYTFLEPSAGSGAFYHLFGNQKKLGFDLMPMTDGVIQQDFLSWYPKDNKYITIGNPPFGYRAWLALSFMQHAALFSDYIAMILPMAFQSDGKGSPKNRVPFMKLVYSETLPKGSFIKPDGAICNVNALFQIWEKGEAKKSIIKTCKDWIDIFTVDLRKERLCGMNKIRDADAFLQRTYFGCHPPCLVNDFADVKYTCGYGLIFKKNKDILRNALNGTDWNVYSNLAAHNCRHISMYHIEKSLTDKGFSDDRLQKIILRGFSIRTILNG
ncbi:MAG: hypothetical protein LBM19_04090 [Holosporales bacterium]|jgi:hypothetical protein|nr:hypothetical protein [Holosporales bacterium]